MGNWYYSTDGGEFYNQASDREDAERSLDGRGGFIGRGSQPEVKLSEQFDVPYMLEGFEESLYEIGGDDPIFDCNKEQQKDLEIRLRKAADEWQKAHSLRFNQWSIEFTEGPHQIAPTPTAS